MPGERLNDTAAVKGTMLRAHLAWAAARLGDLKSALVPLLSPQAAAFVLQPVLATDWVLFKSLVEIDRAVAGAAAGATPESVFDALGRESARVNLAGAYRAYVSSEPHRFFEKSSLLHDRFQNFGHCLYERTGERSGRMTMTEYPVHSPVFCSTGRGYYAEALALMHAPGPIEVSESSCLCRGDAACVFELRW